DVIMAPIKSLQEWSADCVAECVLQSRHVSQLAKAAFVTYMQPDKYESNLACLRELKEQLNNFGCISTNSHQDCHGSCLSGPTSRILKERIGSVAENQSTISQMDFIKSSILKLLVLEEFSLYSRVNLNRNQGFDDLNDFDNFVEDISDTGYLEAFIRILERYGPFSVEKMVITYEFTDTDCMKYVLEALFNNCTEIKSIHLAGKSVHVIALSLLKCFSQQLIELVLIDSFGILTKDAFCVSLLGRPWIEYISSHDGRNSCLEAKFPSLQRLWYQRSSGPRSWNDCYMKTAVMAYYPNLKGLNWRISDFSHSYSLTRFPGLSGQQYSIESLLLTTEDLSSLPKSEKSSKLMASVDVCLLPQLFPGLQDISLVFSRPVECKCERSEMRTTCESKINEISETLCRVFADCNKIESMTAGGNVVHLDSILLPILKIFGRKLKSLGLQLHSSASVRAENVINIISLCPNLESLAISGVVDASLCESISMMSRPKVKVLQLLLNTRQEHCFKLMNMLVTGCIYVQTLCIGICSTSNLHQIFDGANCKSLTTLILPSLYEINYSDIASFIEICGSCFPALKTVYVVRQLKCWRLLQEKLWNFGITVKFTDVLVNAF
ncbi:unnamed protein product, partial [Meganyctiphanes norvegica]